MMNAVKEVVNSQKESDRIFMEEKRMKYEAEQKEKE